MFKSVFPLQVFLYPLETCSTVTTCGECTEAGPLCGWCTVENKCSRRSQCQNVSITSSDICPSKYTNCLYTTFLNSRVIKAIR